MRLAEGFATSSLEAIKAALDGGKLVVFSTGRPPLADHAVTRSAPLATFIFASPAFSPDPGDADGTVAPNFAENPVAAVAVGTPSFARLFKADGTVVADLSAVPGPSEVKFSEVSATPGHPLKLITLRLPLPAETVTFAKTAFGHVFVTGSDDPYRKVSIRG